MTTTTFRTQAIATLKQLRTDGYELTIKLNASNEMLHAELTRLTYAIERQEAQLSGELQTVQTDLDKANEQRYQAADELGLTNVLESSTDTADAKLAQRITQRSEAAKALTGKLSDTFTLVFALVALVLSLPLAMMNQACDHVERKALEHCPLTINALVSLGDAAQAIKVTKVLDTAFCLS